jgi:MFS family permease
MYQKAILQRLLPLYVSSFFQGLVFWYAIEKVFMTSIGFSPTTIAIQIIVMAITGLLLEIPSGFLADKWSRKGVLVLASISLALASLLLGISDSVIGYTLASIIWRIFCAAFRNIRFNDLRYINRRARLERRL